MIFKEKLHGCVIRFVNCHNFTSTEVVQQWYHHNEQRKSQATVTFYPHTFSPHAPWGKHTLQCEINCWNKKPDDGRGLSASATSEIAGGWATQHHARLSPKALSGQDFRKTSCSSQTYWGVALSYWNSEEPWGGWISAVTMPAEEVWMTSIKKKLGRT